MEGLINWNEGNKTNHVGFDGKQYYAGVARKFQARCRRHQIVELPFSPSCTERLHFLAGNGAVKIVFSGHVYLP